MKYNSNKIYIVFDGTSHYGVWESDLEMEKMNNDVEVVKGPYNDWSDIVDDESKTNFIEQIVTKCEAYEFKEEKDVVDFAKSLVAMYYYENQASHTNMKSNDFSIGIETPKTVASTKSNKLSDAISKLNKLN